MHILKEYKRWLSKLLTISLIRIVYDFSVLVKDTGRDINDFYREMIPKAFNERRLS